MFKIISNKNDTNTGTNRARGIALGVFDGLHLGHKELLNELISNSNKLNVKPCAYTFVNDEFYEFKKKNKISNGYIATSETRIQNLLGAGVTEVIVQSFSKEFANMTAENFLNEVLFKKLQVKLVVVGFNYRFGKGALGDVDFIKQWGQKNNIKVIIVEPVKYLDNIISSTRIRKFIKRGDVTSVNAMLGKKYCISGIVSQGQRIGKSLGFPTANIKVDETLAMLHKGVYVTKTKIDNRVYESITNIGTRPSVALDSNDIYAETLILDMDMNLYNKNIDVYFIKYLRPEKKFESIDELKKAIASDIEKCKSEHVKVEDFSLIAKAGNVDIYGIKSERFSSTTMDISFKLPVSKKIASVNNLLCSVLTATCEKYPKRPLLSQRLDELYGAYADYNVDIFGDMHVSTISIDALFKFKDQNPFKDTVELLFDMIESPDTDKNMNFNKEIVNSQRVGIISDIMARKNDKQKYVFDKGLEEYTKGTNFGLRSFGDIKTLNKITLRDLKEGYYNLINNSKISIVIAGNYSNDIVNEIIVKSSKIFEKNNGGKPMPNAIFPESFIPISKNKELSETLNIEQSKLCMIFKHSVNHYSQKTIALSILNLMLGGDVHSLLFQNVRENMGLAYSIYSTPMKYLSSIIMLAGVAHEKVDIAKVEMAKQVQYIVEDQFEDELFNSSILSANYSNNSVQDNLHSIISYYSNNLIKGVDISLLQAKNYINSVSRQDIVDLAKNIELKTVYTITKKQ